MQTKLKIHDLFEKIADIASKHIGGAWSFSAAVIVVALWAFTKQDIFDPLITVATFLFVFLIQNSQNRSEKAIQIKLNEIILSLNKARNDLLDIETRPEKEIDEVSKSFKAVAEEEREAI